MSAGAETRPAKGPRPTIVLVGMRAAGKTTVGRALAELVGRPFQDLDERTLGLARLCGEPATSPGDLLARAGTPRFRELEAWALRSLLEPQVRCVLASGGGTVEREDNRVWLARSAFVVWIQAPVALLRERVLADGPTRPALGGGDALGELEALAARRAPLYAAVADRSVASEGDPAQLARKIAGLLPNE